MTFDEYIESVMPRVTKGAPGEWGLVATAIAQQKDTVLQRLAENVAHSDNPAVQSLLQKTWSALPLTLTAANGAVAVPSDALGSGLPNAQIIVSDGGANIFPEPAEWVGTVFDLQNPPPVFDYIFFTVHRGLLKFSQYTVNGIVAPTLNGNPLTQADVTSGYIPTLTSIGRTDDVADILFDTAVAMFNESEIVTETAAVQD